MFQEQSIQYLLSIRKIGQIMGSKLCDVFYAIYLRDPKRLSIYIGYLGELHVLTFNTPINLIVLKTSRI